MVQILKIMRMKCMKKKCDMKKWNRYKLITMYDLLNAVSSDYFIIKRMDFCKHEDKKE